VEAATGAATFGVGASTGGTAAGFVSLAASISPFVTRPALPVPVTAVGLIPVSSAIRRTAGETAASAAACLGALAGVAAAGAAAPAATSVLITATAWPIFTSEPAVTFKETCPAASAVPSEVILSVSSSNRAWSFLTISPSLTCHLARTPEVMDSPIGGILTSMIGINKKV